MQTFEILFAAILVIIFCIYSCLPIHLPLNRFLKKLEKSNSNQISGNDYADFEEYDGDIEPMAKFNFGFIDKKASIIIYNIASHIQNTESYKTDDLKAYLIRYQSSLASKFPQVAYYAFILSIFSFIYSLNAKSFPNNSILISLFAIFALLVLTAYRYNLRHRYSLIVLIKILENEIQRREFKPTM